MSIESVIILKLLNGVEVAEEWSIRWSQPRLYRYKGLRCYRCPETSEITPQGQAPPQSCCRPQCHQRNLRLSPIRA